MNGKLIKILKEVEKSRSFVMGIYLKFSVLLILILVLLYSYTDFYKLIGMSNNQFTFIIISLLICVRVFVVPKLPKLARAVCIKLEGKIGDKQ